MGTESAAGRTFRKCGCACHGHPGRAWRVCRPLPCLKAGAGAGAKRRATKRAASGPPWY